MKEEFGVHVMRVHELLKDVVDDPEGRAYILDRKLVPNEVGVGGAHRAASLDGRNGLRKPGRPPDRRGDRGMNLPEDFRNDWLKKHTPATEFRSTAPTQPIVHS